VLILAWGTGGVLLGGVGGLVVGFWGLGGFWGSRGRGWGGVLGGHGACIKMTTNRASYSRCFLDSLFFLSTFLLYLEVSLATLETLV
jgi:hypothetical protein